MQSERLEKTYIDSNIWFSYITEGKYDNTFVHVKKLIEEILDKDKSIIVISDLVVLEMISVIRTKIVQRESFTEKIEKNPRIATGLYDLIKRYTTKFMEKFTESTSTGKIEIVREYTNIKIYAKGTENPKRNTRKNNRLTLL